MKHWAFILFFLTSVIAASDVYMVETKVHRDLENALSHLIEPNLFLVQVVADIGMVSERRVVEGETIVMPPQEAQAPTVTPMPGFVPEPNFDPKPQPPPVRQVYRTVDVPVLNAIRANVSFDETVPTRVIDKARLLIQTYLNTNYPNKGRVSFSQLPMLKPKLPEPTPAPPPTPTPAPTPTPKSEGDIKAEYEELRRKEQEQLFKYILMAAAGLILFLMLLVLRRQNQKPRIKIRRPKQPAFPQGAYAGNFPPGMSPYDMNSNWRGAQPYMPEEEKKKEKEAEEETEERKEQTPAPKAELVEVKKDPVQEKNRLLQKFLTNPDAFRVYYTRLTKESQDELYGVLKGTLYDGILQSLEVYKPTGQVLEPANPEECIDRHHIDFDEFTKTQDWQKRQFFGFLQYLTEEQLFALVNHESPLAVCMMLRFLKANQSAMILDALSPQRRAEIIEKIPAVQHAPFSDIIKIEKEVRTAVDMMPKHLYGSPKEDIEFWGSVLSESQHQDDLLKDLEKTQPEIYPNLKKFKFRLEDASALPDTSLKKVLDEVDNEELGLALASCSQDVVDVFLEALSAKRRDVLAAQLVSAKNAPKEQMLAARSTLTKRFREVLG